MMFGLRLNPIRFWKPYRIVSQTSQTLFLDKISKMTFDTTSISSPPTVPASITPPPWTLRGDGYMIFYRFSRDFVEKHGRVPPGLEGCFAGGFGAVMLVNYRESPVGPYRELLFIPGKFRTPRGRRYSITRIVVDSDASTRSGRANWGIPKFTTSFSTEKTKNTERIRVFDASGNCGFDVTLRAGGLHFPVTTALMPLHLYQELEGTRYLTTPKGSGRGQLARVDEIWIDPAFFPDVRQAKPLLALRVENFKMVFPEADRQVF
jgi:hypothetical protein